MKRILVVNVNWLGDVVFSSPVFYALKKEYPQSYIVCLADPRVNEVLNHIDVIDYVIEYDEKGKHKGLFGKLSVVKALSAEKFDVAYMLHGSNTKAYMVQLAGVKNIVGGSIKKKQKFLTFTVEKNEAIQHRSDDYLQIIEGYGINVEERQTRLCVSEDELKQVDDILREYGIDQNDKIIGINVGANWELKRWSNNSFRQVILNLIENNYKVLVIGTDKDKNDVEQIIKGVDSVNCVNLVGKTSLKLMIGVLKRIDLFICADSGPLHIANSLGTSVIGLYGPTRPEVTSPRGSGKAVVLQHDVGCNRQPCYYLQCPDNVCMQAILVNQVLVETEKLLNAN